ncbi:hypothetical protein F4780DRAFT_470565 [Xylariomycetidae sp. FL0641]|nr:hypothetical protein F4780DRAFT_470565 [Xylariomycetidae sp. FL0641]
MVGVPGRSKACLTCLRRRLRCDEAKPFCHRCAKAGFECLGYERPMQWRHTSTTSASFHVSGVGKKPLPSPSESSVLAPVRELSLDAFEDRVHTSFMFRNFTWRSFGLLWLEHACDGKLGGLSLEAAKALSQFNFGLCNKLKEVELKGAMLYGKCLRIMASKLGNDRALAQGRQDLLVPILLLMMIASIQADKAAAVYHLKAVAKVLLACGPEVFQHDQPLRNAFEAGRATLLVASLSSRRRTFLENPRWQDVPFAHEPNTKTSQSYLLDIFIVIPGLLEDLSRLDDRKEYAESDFTHPSLAAQAHSDQHASLCGRIATLLRRLYLWRWDWQHKHGHYVGIDSPMQSYSDPGYGVPSPSRAGHLRFDRPVYASDITLYNAALMWLLALLWKLEPFDAATVIERCAREAIPADACLSHHFSETGFVSFAPLQSPGVCFSIREPALEICRIFEWQAQNHERHAVAGEQACLYLFPIGMARSVLESGSEEQEWIQSLLDAHPVTRGYGNGSDNIVGFKSFVTKEALGYNVQPIDAATC